MSGLRHFATQLAGMRFLTASLLIAGGLHLAGGLAAQDSGERADETPSFFALPWEIDFPTIRRAMAEQSFELEHVRRVLDRRDPRRPVEAWLGVRERLRHAAVGPDGVEAFDLQFIGVEGATIEPSDSRMRAEQFDSHAGFLFHYQSFRVSDAELAARNYEIRFHGIGTRLERPVYRVSVISKLAARSRWVLDLDVETGYPLYRTEYDVGGQRVGEVAVVRFDPTFDGAGLAPAVDPTVQRVDQPAVAFTRANLPDRGVPASDVLPTGYGLSSSAVITDLFSGEKKVRLVYTDGIDHIFVIAGADTRASLGPGHVIGVYQDATGMTQCLFVHDKVEYLVIGRGSHDLVRPTTSALYAQVVR